MELNNTLSLESRLRRIQTLFDIQRYKECAVLSRETIAVFPNDWRACNLLALCLFNLKQREKACLLLKETIGRFPDNHKLWISMGQILYLSNRFKEGLEWLEKAREADPQSVFVHVMIADCNLQMKNFHESERSALKALELGSGNELAMKSLVWSRLHRKDQYVEQDVRNYLNTWPNSFDAHFAAAVYYMRNKMVQEAATHFKTALSISPGRENELIEYKSFLLEHLPHYYRVHRPGLKSFGVLLFVEIIGVIFCTSWKLEIVGLVLIFLQLMVVMYYLFTRNDFFAAQIKEGKDFDFIYRNCKTDLLEYLLIYLGGILVIAQLAGLEYYKTFNVLFVFLHFLPKYTFLPTNEDRKSFHPNLLLNLYMVILLVMGFFFSTPMLGHFIVMVVWLMGSVLFKLRDGKNKLPEESNWTNM